MGQFYEKVGEKKFCAVSKILISLLLALPILYAIINFSMILDLYNYDAYKYNEKCMVITYILYLVMTVWSILYYGGKIQSKKMGFKDVFNAIKKNELWLLFWIALLIWTIIPISFSASPLGAIIGITFLNSGYLSHIFMWGLMGCAAMVGSAVEKDDICKSFVLVSDVLVAIMLGVEMRVPIICLFTTGHGISVYTNRNHYGYVIAVSCMIMCGMYLKGLYEKAALKTQLFYIVSFAVSMYALMINDTLGAYLAIVIAYLVCLILWKASGKKLGAKRFIPLAIIVFVTTLSALELIPTTLPTTIGQSLVVLFQDIFKIAHKSEGYEDAGSLRMIIWMNTVEMIKAHPIVGYGPDVMFDKFDTHLMDTPHNEYLECAFFLGIPGLILYLGGLFTAFVGKCKKIKELSTQTLVAAGAIIGYLISAFVGVRKYNTVCYLFLFIGVMIAQKESVAEEPVKPEESATNIEETEETIESESGVEQ